MGSLGVATLGSEFDPSGMEAGLSKAQQSTDRFLSGWQQAFSTAMGFIIRDVILGLGRAIVNLGKDALNATAEWERMGLSMEALVARELRARDSTLSMADAIQQAQGRTQELLGWVQKLAIQSPFDVKSVQNAFQTALAYGFTTTAAQKLTGTMIDFAAATGKDASIMNNIALALGQIKAKGKLAGQEILQLVNAGIPVVDILGKMGFKLEDVSSGAVKADAFIKAFTDTLDHDFGGAAARQTNTWTGLMNSFEDVKKIGLRTLFKGTFDALQPLVSKFMSWLQGPGMVKLEQMGTFLGNITQGFVDMLGVIGRVQFFFSNLDKGMTVKGALHRLMPDLNLDGAVSKKFIDFLEKSLGIIRFIVDGISKIGSTFQEISGRVRFFFTNLQKGMTFEGALQRLVPDIDLSKLLDNVGSALKKAFSGSAGLAIGGVLGWNIITGAAKLFTSSKAMTAIGTGLKTLFSGIGGWLFSGLNIAFSSISPMIGGIFFRLFMVGGGITQALSFLGPQMFTGILMALSSISPLLGGAFFRIFMTGGIAQGVGAALANIFGGWTFLATTLGPALSGLVTFAAPLLAMAGAIMFLAGAFQMFQSGDLDQPFFDIRLAFGEMASTFMSMMPLIQQLGSQIWEGFLTSSRQLAEQVIPWLVKQVQNMAVWFETNRPLIERFFTVIADVITNNVLPAIVGMWQFIEPLLTGIIDLVLGLATAIMQMATGDWSGAWNTILLVVQNVGDAIGKAVYGFLNWIANIFGSSLTEIGTVWSNNWAMFVNIMGYVGDQIVQALVQAWNFGLDDLINAILGVLGSVLQAVLSFLGIQSPSTVFLQIGADIIMGLINGILSLAGVVISTFIGLGLSILQTMTLAWNNIMIATQFGLNMIYLVIFVFFTLLQTYFTNIWMTITTITTLAWFNIQQVIIAALMGLSEIIFGFAKPIADKIQYVFDEARNKANTLGKGFVSAGKAIVDGIISGITAGAGAIMDAVAAVIADAIAAAMDALDANSPSVVFTNIGSYIPAGLSKGVTEGVGLAVRAVEKASMEIGAAMLPSSFAVESQNATAGSFATAPVSPTIGTTTKQVGPFYGTVNVGKTDDLDSDDPLESAKVM